MRVSREISDVSQSIFDKTLFRRTLGDARSEDWSEHLGKEGQDIESQRHGVGIVAATPASPLCKKGDAGVAATNSPHAAGAASVFAPPSAAGVAGAAFGLPGLGNRNCLCSKPLFFKSDETVSEGTAP